jgi:farnesol dehydrogenase
VRVLVTGVSGFLGGRIAHALSIAGHEVRGLVRDPGRWTGRPTGAHAVTGDVTDLATMRSAAAGCDAIIHAAALVKTWVKDRSAFDRTNVGGLRNALDAAAAAGAKLIYTSSFIALGPSDGTTLHEESPRAPGTPANDYERTKWAADRLAREAAAAGASIVRLYPGVVYGPGSLTEGNHLVQNLVKHAHGKLPGMLGAGDRRMCFAFVEDVASGFAAALERAAPGAAYILGGENRTLAELFSAFERETGIPPPRVKIPFAVARVVGKLQRWRAEAFGTEPELTDEVVEIYRREWAYSSERAMRELGYRVTPFDEGIARTVAWLIEEDLIAARPRRA